MKLSAPKQITFYIAVILWVIALVGLFVPGLQPVAAGTFLTKMGWAFWAALIGELILVLGNLMDGL